MFFLYGLRIYSDIRSHIYTKGLWSAANILLIFLILKSFLGIALDLVAAGLIKRESVFAGVFYYISHF